MTEATWPRQNRRFLALTISLATLIAFSIAGCAGQSIDDQVEQAFPVLLASISDKILNSLPANNATPESQPFVGPWPPSVGDAYPDLNLTDQNGAPFQLSSLSGKVILLELVAIPCKGCQAFAGGNQRGGYGGISVQPGLDSIQEYTRRFGDVNIDRNSELAFVQVVLYGKSMNAPTQQEVMGWASHFGMDRSQDQIVLRGDQSMISRATYDMIPGFHLIDRDFVFQYDSSGHHPDDDLYRDLLPALGQMTRRR